MFRVVVRLGLLAAVVTMECLSRCWLWWLARVFPRETMIRVPYVRDRSRLRRTSRVQYFFP
jgi:hypothetical protein